MRRKLNASVVQQSRVNDRTACLWKPVLARCHEHRGKGSTAFWDVDHLQHVPRQKLLRSSSPTNGMRSQRLVDPKLGQQSRTHSWPLAAEWDSGLSGWRNIIRQCRMYIPESDRREGRALSDPNRDDAVPAVLPVGRT